MKTYMLLLIGLCSLSTLTAQFQVDATYDAINQFATTSFFKEFLEAKRSAEKIVTKFKRENLSNYSEEEILLIEDAYNESADYFNTVLFNIKRDMLNKDIRKYMTQFPDLYSKQVEYDLVNAKEFYANTFQKTLREITGEEDPASFMALLPQLIKYTKTAFQLLQNVKAKIKKFNEGLIDQYLIAPYRFKKWDEITA
ncbi:MAG: hypothetical protein KTR30_19270 [Saprospiraceae bacterium]|nr:hypothetical protein [Saprospiraceae bacterium]